MHSWAQMVEQTLVITLFIEHSDMHIYVFPKKERTTWFSLSSPQVESSEAKIQEVQIILSKEFQSDLFGLFGGCLILRYQTMRVCRVSNKHSPYDLVPLIYLISTITWCTWWMEHTLSFTPLLSSWEQTVLARWMNQTSYLSCDSAALCLLWEIITETHY